MSDLLDGIPGMTAVSSLTDENTEHVNKDVPTETQTTEAPITEDTSEQGLDSTKVSTQPILSEETNIVAPDEHASVPVDNQPSNIIEEDISIIDLYKKIDDHLIDSYGYDLDDVKTIQSIDTDSMGSLEILRTSMLLNDPEITDIEIDAALSEFKYLDEDRYSDEQINELIENGTITEDFLDLLSAKFSREERNAIKQINEIKSKLPNLSEVKYMVKKAEQQSSQPKIEEQINVLKTALTDSMKDYSKETFKITNEKGEIVAEVNFNVNDNAKSGVINTMTGNQNMMWQRWLTEKEGQVSVDYSKMRRDVLLLDRFNEISNVIFSEGVAHGTKNAVEKIDNIDFRRGSNGDASSMKPLSAEDKARNTILG